MYQYVDDEGVTHYTNELSSVPPEKLSEVIEHEEHITDPASASSSAPDKRVNARTQPANLLTEFCHCTGESFDKKLIESHNTQNQIASDLGRTKAWSRARKLNNQL